MNYPRTAGRYGLQTKAAGHDDDDDLEKIVEALAKRDGEIKSFVEESNQTIAAANQTIAEQGARLLEVEQKLARRGGAPSTAPSGGIEAGPGDVKELHDVDGKRVGTVLTKAAMQSRNHIAAALSTQSTGEGSIADFMRAVAGTRTTPDMKAALAEGTDNTGGYAVPNWLLPGILQALVPASSLLTAGVNVGLLSQQGKSFNIAAIDSLPTATWRNENAPLSESEPSFRNVTITPRDLSFILKVSRELLTDAPGIDQALQIAIAQAFAKEIDRAGLIGSGTAPEILGLANTAGINTYSMGPAGAALTSYAPIIHARRAIADASGPQPNAIIMSSREDETIALFADTTGQPLRRPDALAQLKFVPSAQIEFDSDDAAEMYLGNFPMATSYFREQLSVQRLNELYAGNGQVGFACHARVDFAAAYPAAFCKITGVIPS